MLKKQLSTHHHLINPSLLAGPLPLGAHVLVAELAGEAQGEVLRVAEEGVARVLAEEVAVAVVGLGKAVF